MRTSPSTRAEFDMTQQYAHIPTRILKNEHSDLDVFINPLIRSWGLQKLTGCVCAPNDERHRIESATCSGVGEWHIRQAAFSSQLRT